MGSFIKGNNFSPSKEFKFFPLKLIPIEVGCKNENDRVMSSKKYGFSLSQNQEKQNMDRVHCIAASLS